MQVDSSRDPFLHSTSAVVSDVILQVDSSRCCFLGIRHGTVLVPVISNYIEIVDFFL